MTVTLPDQILDIVLTLAVAGLALGASDRRTALDLVNQDALRHIVGVAASGLAPSTTRLALLLFKHCTMAAAAGNGRLDILTLRQAFGLLEKDSDKSVDDRHPMSEATRGGHFKVLEFLQQGRGALYHYVHIWDVDQAMTAASLAGRVEMLVYWRQHKHCLLNHPSCLTEYSVKNYIIHPAIDGGSIPVLEWWAAQLPHGQLSDPKYPARMAAQRKTEALSWWYANCAQGTPAESPYTWTVEQLTDFGVTATSALFRAQLHPSQRPDADSSPVSIAQDRLIMTLLTARSVADDLDWWTDVRGADLPAFSLLCPEWNCTAMPSVLDWWWEKVSDPKAFSRVITFAVSRNHTNTLDWAKSRGIMKQKRFKLDGHISTAVTEGKVASLVWFYTHQYPVSITPSMLREASRNGHVQILDWLARTLPLSFPWAGAEVVETASASGHTNVLDWWIAAARDPTLPPGRVPRDYSAKALDTASALQVLDWWLFGSHGLPLKYTDKCVSSISQWKNGDAPNALNLWVASGHPFLYDHAFTEHLALKAHVPTLEWWRTSGYPLKMTREGYDRLYLQSRLLNGNVIVRNGQQLVWDQRQIRYSGAAIRWWDVHVFREGGDVRIEILEPPAPSPPPPRPSPPRPSSLLSRLGRLLKF